MAILTRRSSHSSSDLRSRLHSSLPAGLCVGDEEYLGSKQRQWEAELEEELERERSHIRSGNAMAV